uniref:Uncharacterized protein n=1 Tax=Lepeophtheirus salmonis TaxID=72036 RepID=A0A0K2UBB5_LEPSM
MEGLLADFLSHLEKERRHILSIVWVEY